MSLISKMLYASISTFETPPGRHQARAWATARHPRNCLRILLVHTVHRGVNTGRQAGVRPAPGWHQQRRKVSENKGLGGSWAVRGAPQCPRCATATRQADTSTHQASASATSRCPVVRLAMSTPTRLNVRNQSAASDSMALFQVEPGVGVKP